MKKHIFENQTPNLFLETSILFNYLNMNFIFSALSHANN